MAKPTPLTVDDLSTDEPRDAVASKPKSAARQRGENPEKAPPVKRVPMQFSMPDEFVQDFKKEALAARMKLNQLLEAAFEAYKKTKRAGDR